MSIYSEIQAFIAVVEEQSFTKAANKLAVTPTAISKQIKELESRFHQQLLLRSTRQVSITEIGERFYQHCKRVEQEIGAVWQFIQFQQVEPQGKLRILSSLFFAHSWLLQYLPEFHERYPLIQLEIELADRIPDIEREGFDLLIGFSLLPQIDPQLRSRRLLTTHYMLCASETYLQKYGVPYIPLDLKKHKLINHPLREPSHLVRFKDGTQIYMDPPDILINDMEALIALCCEGMGILMVSEIQVAEILKQNKLIHLLPDYPMDDVSVYLFYRHTEYEQNKIRCFIDFLLEKISVS